VGASAQVYTILTVYRVREGKRNIQDDTTRVGLVGDELLPSFGSFTDNVGGISKIG
jgi:hypothetical protein